MTYSFRVRFRLGTSRIHADDAAMVLADPVTDGEDIKILVAGESNAIKDAEMLAIWGVGYPTRTAAKEAGENGRGACSWRSPDSVSAQTSGSADPAAESATTRGKKPPRRACN